MEKNYKLLENNLFIVQNELEQEKESAVTIRNINRNLLRKVDDYESTEWKNGILYCNGVEICSRCYDTSSRADRKTVRLLANDPEIMGVFYCPECKTPHQTTEGARQQRNKYREVVRQALDRGY
ncbi:MAG: hypothetical protein Q8K75_02015 [Chlamydiales bacterium]|nr:hypothetical protein [Chlamydiales bacterium]